MKGVGLFSQVTGDKTQGNSLTVYQGKFRLDVGKNLFLEKFVQALEWAAQGSGEIPFLDVSKRCGEVALKDMV